MAGRLFSTGFDVDPLTGMPLQQMKYPTDSDAQLALAYQMADMSPTPTLTGGQPLSPEQVAAAEGPSIMDQLSTARMPTGGQIFGDEASRAASPLGRGLSALKKYGNTDSGKVLAQSILDMNKRIQMQPVLETEALFKAFNRPSNLSETTEKGILGSDLLSDLEEGKMLNKKRAQDEKRQNLVDRILEAQAAKLKSQSKQG